MVYSYEVCCLFVCYQLVVSESGLCFRVHDLWFIRK